MVRIRISERERVLLEKSLKEYSSEYGFPDFKTKIDDLIVFIDSDVANILDLIINCLVDLFCVEGLQKNDEPNELGLELENLKDKFIKELWKINN